eukprot:1158188-Pelagomonas_calceolata.AAC.4
MHHKASAITEALPQAVCKYHDPQCFCAEPNQQPTFSNKSSADNFSNITARYSLALLSSLLLSYFCLV